MNVNNGKNLIANVVGSPLLTTDTFQQQTEKLQSIKNIITNNLNEKGQISNSKENLMSLAYKISNINIGKKWAGGTGKAIENSKDEVCMLVTDLNFEPQTVIILTRSDNYNNDYIVIDCPLFKYKTWSWYDNRYIILDNGSVYKNSKGFNFYEKNYTIGKDTTFQWMAFE